MGHVMLSDAGAAAALAAMTDAQVTRTAARFFEISGAFDDIRDAIAQAVEDELAAIAAEKPSP